MQHEKDGILYLIQRPLTADITADDLIANFWAVTRSEMSCANAYAMLTKDQKDAVEKKTDADIAARRQQYISRDTPLVLW